MNKTLIIFLSSDNRDTYVNSITHAVRSEDIKARRIIFIHVQDAISSFTNEQAKTVMQDIFRQINSLSHGQYLTFARYNKDGNNISPEVLNPLINNNKFIFYSEVYSLIQEYTILHTTKKDLKRDLINSIRSSGGIKNCLVDITSSIKSPAIEIFTIYISIGINHIYSFELLERFNPNDPTKSLYHELDNSKFTYTLITETPLIKEGLNHLVRRKPLIYYFSAIWLLIALFSFIIFYVYGPNNLFTQILGIAGTVVGLISFTPIVVDLSKKF